MSAQVSSNVKIPVLKEGSDYNSWSDVMMRHLKSLDLWDVVVVKSEGNKLDDKAYVTIFTSLSEGLARQVNGCKTSHDLWVKIKLIHQGSSQEIKNKAMTDFFDIKVRPSEKMNAFLVRFEETLLRLLRTGYCPDESCLLSIFEFSLKSTLISLCGNFNI